MMYIVGDYYDRSHFRVKKTNIYTQTQKLKIYHLPRLVNLRFEWPLQDFLPLVPHCQSMIALEKPELYYIIALMWVQDFDHINLNLRYLTIHFSAYAFKLYIYIYYIYIYI